MARKKIWAYARKTDGEYIQSEKVNKERLFFIWEALKIRREDPKAFSQLTFMSTQSSKDKRAELITVKNGFFRYKSDAAKGKEVANADHDSFSHELAIAVLAEMETIKFQTRDKVYEITFDHLRKDDLKIRFEDGAVYYPDLMGFFSQPATLAQKWGGKVAIEVKVTHGCEQIKIKDFFEHNIPIIEIFLRPSMRLQAENDKKEFNERQMENYYRYLQQKFSSVVYMDILSDPIMPGEFNKIVKYKNEAISSVEAEKLRLEKEIDLLTEFENQQKTSLDTLRKERTSLLQAVSKHKEKGDRQEEENAQLRNNLHKELRTSEALRQQIAGLEENNYQSMGFMRKLARLFS